jgi:adenine/guanine phosphoribosyltransferase-like PRPP-binding protein
MIIEFTSIVSFLKRVNTELINGNLSSAAPLQIGTTKPSNLLDLFALGRLLALLHALKRSPYQLEAEFVFPLPRRNVKIRKQVENLRKLGFFKYCEENNIKCEFATKPQLYLPIVSDVQIETSNATIKEKTYWRCLIPLQKSPPFIRPSAGNERQVTAIVHDYIRKFTDQLQSSLKEAGIDYKDISLELSRVLFSIVRELLSNTVTHSGQSEFLFAMTISREIETGVRPHRPGVTFSSGQDKYELLVMDFGRGIFPSVIHTLNYENAEQVENDYFSVTGWSDFHRVYKAKEESLLSNIFRGDLVIRKGRKSEGLYELGQALAWFDGVLSLFTGRSDLQITLSDSEEIISKPRRITDPYVKNPYYLPGVIASPILPSHQLKSVFIKNIASNLVKDRVGLTPTTHTCKPCVIRRYKHGPPSGFFGGLSTLKIRRRSELDAEALITDYQKERDRASVEGVDEGNAHPFEPFFWDLNLNMADNIDVGFIDSFIQELCKRIDQVEPSSSRNFYKLIFTNVPSNIIHALEKRNCKSFLMLKETFCLLLDEADEPHFLGVPRVSNNIFDIEDALSLIFRMGSITREELINHKDIGLTEYAVDHLQKLLGPNEDSIFFCRDVDGQVTFECYDIRKALSRMRYESFTQLSHVRLYEGTKNSLDAVFKLRNGVYVDSLYDFCLYWSDNERSVDCSKLLLSCAGFPLVDTIVTFMNNGDRLASAIQRFTKTPNLIIADPHNSDSWKDLEIDGDCVLVVDALYPGDDQHGYIKTFVENIDKVSRNSRIKQLLAFCDFRYDRESTAPSDQTQQRANPSLSGLEVISVPLPKEVVRPAVIHPQKEHSIVQNFQNYILSKPQQHLSTIASHNRDASWRADQYSPVELSTEFWQNVSALGVIGSKRTGREERNVLFYENNERLIQNSRMRRAVTEFVADYVKNILDLKVDVILHPTHPVGSFLAQLVSAQLNDKPLVLPLTQRKYGGQIEITSGDYLYSQRLVEEFKRIREREQLTCLIVDDSVLTGNSLFTMLGISARLGLQTNGILVLLSRLSPEISNALSLLSVNFAYLYRLHMPILTGSQSPDTKLKYFNEIILKNSNSYFGQLWANILRSEESHFQPSEKDIEPNIPPTIRAGLLANIEGKHIDTYRLKQILQHLILHPDPHILTFYIRVGIAYNFLERLVHEDDFWRLLQGLFEYDKSLKPNSQSIRFIQKLLYILAFSKHIYPFSVYKKYQDICCNLVRECFENRSWDTLKDLVTDCIMWLGIIGSEKLPEVGKMALGFTLEYALEDLSGPFQAVNTSASSDHRKRTPEQALAAREIIGAFAWSLRVYIHQKGLNMLDNASAADLVDTVVRNQRSTEGHILLIDILEPVISVSSELRKNLSIEAWQDEDDFIEALASSATGNPMLSYLKEAPGYTCTLKMLLRLCKADTVLLYAKNRSDEQFFLRVFDTRQNKSPDDDLTSAHLNEGHLPDALRNRMKESLFFSSTRPEDPQSLNDYSIGAKHLWCMGGPVTIKSGAEMNYYVVFGYKRPPDRKFQSTAYYYWLKCESLLREILPQIHSRYVESATEWNAHIQSIKPIHPIKSDAATRTEFVNVRRVIISRAMSYVDIGDLLRRAVRMSSEPIYRLTAIRGQIEKVCKTMRINITTLLKEDLGIDRDNKSLLRVEDLPVFGPKPAALTSEQELTFCALHMALLEFIAYECLCNALAHYETRIDVDTEFKLRPEEGKIKIILTVKNDLHPEAGSGAAPIKPIGITACKTAASAVGGSFDSCLDTASGLWIASTELPAFLVPDELRRQLHDLLT